MNSAFKEAVESATTRLEMCFVIEEWFGALPIHETLGEIASRWEAEESPNAERIAMLRFAEKKWIELDTLYSPHS